jgi:hypothetical protein
VRFASIGAKATGSLGRRRCQREAGRSTVKVKAVKLAMSGGELAICIEEGRISRDGLVQEIYGLEVIRFGSVRSSKQAFGPGI